MIVDTSALVAILWGEPEASRFEAAMASAPRIAISAVTYIEFVNVVDRKAGEASVAIADNLSLSSESRSFPSPSGR